MFEDANGWFQERSWYEVVERIEEYNTDPRFVEPRYLVFFERDLGINTWRRTNLAMMRLTMGTSLVFTDWGLYGTMGNRTSRSPVFNPRYRIEDYYDEYAVGDSCFGAWSDSFPKDWEVYPPADSIEVPVFEEDHLFESVHYLGEPLGEAKTYTAHSFVRGDSTFHDIFYREFDHGLVLVHYGSCARTRYGMNVVPYEWVWVGFDSLEVVEDPRDEGYHFMGIEGCSWNGFFNPFNDSTNVREHHEEGVYLRYRGDGLILLKEGDGFSADHPPIQN
jgi:hypothetical protein